MSTRNREENITLIPGNDGSYKCSFPDCNASYRRKEHLQRHRVKHSQPEPFQCPNCPREFGRRDTLRRHLRRDHKINEPMRRARKACEGCHLAKSRCEGGPPCEECIRRNIECIFKEKSRVEEERSISLNRSMMTEGTVETLTSNLSPAHFSSTNLLEKREKCIELYFEKFHPYWSFIHRGSFQIHRELPLMVQSMVVIGLWATGEPASQSVARDLHDNLDIAICEQKDKWDASDKDKISESCRWPIATFQAILLHIIFDCMLENQQTFTFDLNISVSSKIVGLLTLLVRSCRNLGMFYYPNILTQFQDMGEETLTFLFIEDTKRFNLALYKLVKKISTISTGDIEDLQIKASELRFPVPKLENRLVWDAVNREEWYRAISIESIGDQIRNSAEDSWISRCAEILDFL